MKRSRNGIAMILAITCLGIVAITLAVIMSAFVSESRRTFSQSRDTQLRQLLLAGELIARDRLSKNQPIDAAIVLPEQLDGATLKVHRESDDAKRPAISITASTAKNNLSQEVTFERAGNSWQIATATLER